MVFFQTRPITPVTCDIYFNAFLMLLNINTHLHSPPPSHPAPPACSTHLQHLIAIRVNESPWKKQAPKAYLHRVKMQVAADLKLDFPPVFINPMFAERLLSIWEGWFQFCLCNASYKTLQTLKTSRSQSTSLKVCSTWESWSTDSATSESDSTFFKLAFLRKKLTNRL